jgi:hypothetical protein
VGIALVAAATAACGERPEPPRVGFVDEPPAAPVPVVVLSHDTTRTAAGFRVVDLDVMLPKGITDAVARASLQRVIDSVARADTLAAAVRVTGLVMGALDPRDNSAPVEPAMRATWGAIDSTGLTGARRTARFRTDFVLLRPLEPSGGPGQVP